MSRKERRARTAELKQAAKRNIKLLNESQALEQLELLFKKTGVEMKEIHDAAPEEVQGDVAIFGTAMLVGFARAYWKSVMRSVPDPLKKRTEMAIDKQAANWEAIHLGEATTIDLAEDDMEQGLIILPNPGGAPS